MIRAFNLTDKVYQTNGDAVIAATKARVKNEDNGDFTLDLTCSSDYSDFIQANNIIVVPTPQGDQAFRVRQVEKRSNRIEAKCYHVFYDAENFLIADSYAVNMTAEQALRHFNDATDTLSPFTMDSNITTLNNLRIVRGSLAEAVVSVIERWGGHLVRDNYNIAVKGAIGVDNGITIEYKKNLKELTASYDWSDVVTKLLPVGKDGVLLDNLYVYSDTQYAIPFTKTITFEQDIEREDYPSDEAYVAALKADLRQQAQNYVNIACVPTINYTLKGNPEKVTDIGDIIEVKDARIGVNVLTKVIAYEYDAITKKYVNLEFGNFTPKLSSLMSDIKAETSLQIASATSNINIEVNSINNNITELNTIVNNLNQNKQNKLIAGQNITITSNNVISATSERGIDVLYGKPIPTTEGENKDFYFTLKPREIIIGSECVLNSTEAHPMELLDFESGGGYYNFSITGNPKVNGEGEYCYFPLHHLIVGNTYTLTFTIAFNSGAQFIEAVANRVTICGHDIILDNTSSETTYTYTFTYVADGLLEFGFYKLKDNTAFQCDVTSLHFEGEIEADDINDLYTKYNGNWLKYNPPSGASSVSDLTDVEINDLANGDILEYDEALQKWKNTANSGGGGVGGNSVYTEKTLYSGNYSTVGTALELNDDITKYDIILTRFRFHKTYTERYTKNSVVKVSDIILGETYQFTECSHLPTINGYSALVSYCFTDATHIRIDEIFNQTNAAVSIVDVVGLKFGSINAIIYSEEEQEVGVWVDNKPLYQKSIPYTFTNRTNDWTLFDDSVSYDKLVSTIGYFINISNQCHPLNSEPNDVPRWVVQSDHKLYYYTTETQRREGHITIWYTKTTDTAGSGSYNTLGVPNVHYTEDEQVIGTYLNKPLYQKSFTLTSQLTVSASSWTNTNLTVSNIDKIVYGDGISEDGTYQGTLATDKNNDVIYLQSCRALNSYVKYLTIKYTKTTD